jgi:hypothetical protein
VVLPERADVLVSEIIGFDPLGERVLETTRDAVQRLLRPDARLIPSSLEVFAVPITLPESVRNAWRFTAPNVARWRSWYDIDFSPLVEASERSPTAMACSPGRLHEWTALSDAVSVLSQDLRRIDQISVTETRAFRATATGRLDAVALWFTLGLSPSVSLSTDPREPRDDNSWDHRVWALPTSLDVEEGEELELTYRYQSEGPPVEVRRLPAANR